MKFQFMLIKTKIYEDNLNLIVVLLCAITSFCLVIGGYKLFCFIETLTYPSINDNVSIGKCGIHESYCIEKTNKSFSYSLGKSTVGCYCCFYWNCKTIFENDAEYELAKQKFALLEKEKEITEYEWKIFKNWIKEILSTKSLSVGEINVVFCSDDYLLNINRQFLGHDYYTDIITFDTSEYNPVESNKRGRISADIFISLDTVLANADTYDTTFNRELYRVIIHGILHMVFIIYLIFFN